MKLLALCVLGAVFALLLREEKQVLAIFVIFGFMWYFMFLRQNGAGGGGDKTARFGRARTRTLADQGDKKVTFDNVAGAVPSRRMSASTCRMRCARSRESGI